MKIEVKQEGHAFAASVLIEVDGQPYEATESDGNPRVAANKAISEALSRAAYHLKGSLKVSVGVSVGG